jgi:hypothetical protein
VGALDLSSRPALLDEKIEADQTRGRRDRPGVFRRVLRRVSIDGMLMDEALVSRRDRVRRKFVNEVAALDTRRNPGRSSGRTR